MIDINEVLGIQMEVIYRKPYAQLLQEANLSPKPDNSYTATRWGADGSATTSVTVDLRRRPDGVWEMPE